MGRRRREPCNLLRCEKYWSVHLSHFKKQHAVSYIFSDNGQINPKKNVYVTEFFSPHIYRGEKKKFVMVKYFFTNIWNSQLKTPRKKKFFFLVVQEFSYIGGEKKVRHIRKKAAKTHQKYTKSYKGICKNTHIYKNNNKNIYKIIIALYIYINTKYI